MNYKCSTTILVIWRGLFCISCNCYIIIRQKQKPLFQGKDKAIRMYIFTVNCDHFDYWIESKLINLGPILCPALLPSRAILIQLSQAKASAESSHTCYLYGVQPLSFTHSTNTNLRPSKRQQYANRIDDTGDGCWIITCLQHCHVNYQHIVGSHLQNCQWR